MVKRPIREAGHLSQRAYAAHRHTDPKEVRQALKDGKIKLEPNGFINAAKADKAWKENTNPASNSKPGAKPGQKAVSVDAVKAASDVLRAAGKRTGDGPMTFTEARTANEIVKAQMGAIRLAERRGELINKKRAEAIAFEWSRRVRDALVVWPSRRAALLANDLGLSPHVLEIALDREVRALLTSLSNIDPNEIIRAIDRLAGKAK
jgi:hypothetical protein